MAHRVVKRDPLQQLNAPVVSTRNADTGWRRDGNVGSHTRRPVVAVKQHDLRVSDNLIRLVQVMFGLVVAQSLLLYRDVVVNPGHPHSVAFLALVVIYAVTITSWIDWHISVERCPYNLSPEDGHSRTEQWRVVTEVLVVCVYAYALFTVAGFESNPAASIARYLFAFPLAFLAYVLSGLLRRSTYGGSASVIRAMLEFGALLAAVWVAYLVLVTDVYHVQDRNLRVWTNVAAIILVLGLTLAYRSRRTRLMRGTQRGGV